MVEIRSTADIAKKWAEVTPARAPQYEEGVRAPRRDWARNTKAQEGSYEAGVQQAIQKKRFGKGVEKAGTEKWQKGAIEKGAARFGPGVSVAQPEYEKGFSPYRDAIEKTTLPPRFARRDPRNIERVKAMMTTMGQEKARQMGG